MPDSPDDKPPQEHGPEDVKLTENPPDHFTGILARLGPGLIIAGSIVGSGELIATTKTGAEAGFTLLWLILIGCVIKVFAQVEFGRYTITTGKTALDGMNEVPGRVAGINWIVWWWLAMFIVGLGQLGGIVGGVGQALAISAPLTQQGRDYNKLADVRVRLRDAKATIDHVENDEEIARAEEAVGELTPVVAELKRTYDAAYPPRTVKGDPVESKPYDEYLWAAAISIITAILLAWGRYGFIQSFSMVMVASFTFVTIINVFALQSYPRWAVSSEEFFSGLTFRLPLAIEGKNPIATALATFGIIGVGASELVAYPYWCLEKGYARFTGPRDKSPEWAERARGWMRVMRWDAWCSMIVYTLATIAFYLLGAAVLFRKELNPEGTDMIRMLAEMYTPVFGAWARLLFLFGSFAVLYSTFFVANAGHARVFSDAMRVFGLIADKPDVRRFWIRVLSAVFPLVCLLTYCVFQAPALLVLAAGFMQAILLPMLGIATLYFRYLRCDERIVPSRLWDIFLWVSVAGLLIAGGWAAWDKIAGLF